MALRHRNWKGIASTSAIIILGLLAVANTFTLGWRPFIGAKARPLTNHRFEMTQYRLERGRYLVEGPLHCFYCHSRLDTHSPGAPPLPGMKGGGSIMPDGDEFGRVVAPNISPDLETGAGAWSDDMLVRAIREGIGHDGRALFPIMPYRNLRKLPDEDVASVVAYLRSIPPVRNPLPKTELSFPFNMLVETLPEPITGPVALPDLSTTIKRGEYLVTLGNCGNCHTPMDEGKPVAGLEFAGGFILKGVSRKGVASANITPDPSGISYYDEALFLKVMHTGRAGARNLDPVMPWGYFRNMTDNDLRAVFAYLCTIGPVKHRVDNTESPTPCKLCKGMHGLGEDN